MAIYIPLMNSDLAVALTILLILAFVWWVKVRQPAAEHMGLAGALQQQTLREMPTMERMTPEEIVQQELNERRFEVMSSPKNNTDDPLEGALHGASALNSI